MGEKSQYLEDVGLMSNTCILLTSHPEVLHPFDKGLLKEDERYFIMQISSQVFTHI